MVNLLINSTLIYMNLLTKCHFNYKDHFMPTSLGNGYVRDVYSIASQNPLSNFIMECIERFGRFAVC